MTVLADDRLYRDVEHCLSLLRQLEVEPARAQPAAIELFHYYWHGELGLKQAFALKSFLATQDLTRSELWLWLDGERGYPGHDENRYLRPLLPFLTVRRFDPAAEVRSTLLEGYPAVYQGSRPIARADLLRHIVLYKYGGTYVDMDTMLLRDLRPLLDNPYFGSEFCYRWSANRPYANSAILRLGRQSTVAQALLASCAERGSCDPRAVLRLDANHQLDLLVLPCAFFDPLWPVHDREGRFEAAPFERFPHFFRKFGWWGRRRAVIRTFRDFFPGAFAYHWHNCWDAPELGDSYFGLFNRELDGLLRERLAIGTVV